MPNVSMERLRRSFGKVRGELAEVGLLADGAYLDAIECVQPGGPDFFWSEAGFVYDEGLPWHGPITGFAPGVIYVPRNAPVTLYTPGGTLDDTVRHEFAHAWAWLDRKTVDGPWFRETFGGRYAEGCDFGGKMSAVFMDYPEEFERSSYAGLYASPYAMSAPKEDFAETFMLFLRHRRSLSRFRSRRGLYRKLWAVEAAVRRVRARVRPGRRRAAG